MDNSHSRSTLQKLDKQFIGERINLARDLLSEELLKSLGKAIQKNAYQLQKVINDQKTDADEKDKTIDQLTLEIKKLNETLQLQAAETEKLQSQHKAQHAKQDQIEINLKQQLKEQKDKNEELIHALEISRTEHVKTQLTIERADETAKKCETEMVQLKAHIEQLRDEKNTLAADAKIAINEKNFLSGHVGELKADLTSAKEEYQQMLQDKQVLQEQLKSAEVRVKGLEVELQHACHGNDTLQPNK